MEDVLRAQIGYRNKPTFPYVVFECQEGFENIISGCDAMLTETAKKSMECSLSEHQELAIEPVYSEAVFLWQRLHRDETCLLTCILNKRYMTRR